MTKTQHTPGPWRAISYSSVVGASVVAQPDPQENSLTVAMVPGPDRATAEANARLIAAAPQLLEALEALVEEAREDDQDASLIHAFILASAAIKAAKARR